MTEAAPPTGQFAMNSPRLLTATPQRVLSLSPAELKTAIAMSEGRTVTAVARVRGANACDGVSNMELCAAFGADIIALGLYDPHNPYFPGLPDLVIDEAEREVLAQVQIEMGRGWTLSRVRELVGRPVAAALYGTESSFPDEMEASFVRSPATVANAELLASQGADIIQIMDWLAPIEVIAERLREIKDAVGDQALISFARPNGWGLFGHLAPEEFISTGDVTVLAESGIDILELPTVGTQSGTDLSTVQEWVKIAHRRDVLVNLWIASSQEGGDTDTIKNLAWDFRKTGADIITISDVNLTEAVPEPENILTLGMAIRGRRHTFRRMSLSVLR